MSAEVHASKQEVFASFSLMSICTSMHHWVCRRTIRQMGCKQNLSHHSRYSLRNDIDQLKRTTHCINERVSMIFNNYICYNNLGLLGNILKVSIHKIRNIVIIITLIHRWHTRRSSGTTTLGGHGTLQLGKIVYAQL